MMGFGRAETSAATYRVCTAEYAADIWRAELGSVVTYIWVSMSHKQSRMVTMPQKLHNKSCEFLIHNGHNHNCLVLPALS